MKPVHLLIIAIFSCSCATPRQDPPVSADTAASPAPSMSQVPTRKHCEEFAEVLRKAIYYDGIQFRFVEDETRAREFLDQVDLGKMSRSSLSESKQVVARCELPRSETVCSYTLPAQEFFQGLLYGIKNYDWSRKTRSTAIGLLVRYGKLLARDKTSLVDIEIITELVVRLVRENFQYKNLRKPAYALKKDLDRTREELKEEHQKVQANTYQCRDLNQLLHIEEQFLSPYSERLLKILDSIKY